MHIQGIVVKGRQEGRKIGFPTANISPNQQIKNTPKQGIYASLIKINNKWHKSVSSYGTAPSYDFYEVVLETYIFDFDKDIYDQEIEVNLVEFLRPVYKYEGIEKLVEQIKLDCQKAKQVLLKY